MADDMQRRIGQGLRRLKRTPDALVFVDGWLDETWDLPTAFDIPVFHTEGFTPPGCGRCVTDCPFFPVWKDDYPAAAVEVARFIDGYCD